MRSSAKKQGSNLERSFDTYWRIVTKNALTAPKKEHRFATEIGRQWRFDRAWPEAKVAVELEGGVYTGGRHVRGAGFEEDCMKYNTAALLGWRVFRITTKMLQTDPAFHIGQIITALTGEENGG